MYTILVLEYDSIGILLVYSIENNKTYHKKGLKFFEHRHHVLYYI